MNDKQNLFPEGYQLPPITINVYPTIQAGCVIGMPLTHEGYTALAPKAKASKPKREVERQRQRNGENSNLSKYSDEQIERVRLLREEGMKQREIAEVTGIDRSYISRILNGKHRSRPTYNA